MPKLVVDKRNQVLKDLQVEYVPVSSIKPNSYNPNRQSEHDFELLCRSIASDGFTQPVIVLHSTKEIVDGEHRWRACKALGFTEIPVVFTNMTPEQARIATLRHNRARGSEEVELASALIQELKSLGALDIAKEELQLDEVEVDRLLRDMPVVESSDFALEITPDKLGPKGSGLSKLDQESNIDTTADTRRAKERALNEIKRDEEKHMVAVDAHVYRLSLLYTGTEGGTIQRVLDKILPGQPPGSAILALCNYFEGT